MRPRLAALLALLAALLPAVVARAGNERSFFHGDEAAMTAGAGVALARDSGALWYNPAGLGGAQSSRMELSGSAFVLRLYRLPDLLQTELPSGTVRRDVTATEFLNVATSLVLVRNWTESLSYGLGVFVTRSQDIHLNDTYKRDEVFTGLGPTEYSQGVDLRQEGSQYYIGPALGWQITPRWRLGAALFGLYVTRKGSSQLFARVGEGTDGETLVAHVSEDVQAEYSILGLKLTVGLQGELLPGWHIGLVVRSPTLAVVRWGDGLESLSRSGLDEQGQMWSEYSHETLDLDHVGAVQYEPVELSASTALRGEDWWVGLEASVMPAIDDDRHDVHRRLVWNLALGSRFPLAEGYEAGLGVFTDRSAAHPPTSLGAGNVDYYGLACGLHLPTAYEIPAPNGKGSLVFATTLAFRYALGTGHVAGMRFQAEHGTETFYPRQDVLFHEISVHLGSALVF